MDPSHQNEVSPFVTNIEVLSPSPTLTTRDFDDEEDEATPYIEDNDIRIYVSSRDTTICDHTQDFSLGSPQALDSPSGSACSSSYYSARSKISELSPQSGLEADSDMHDTSTSSEQHAEYLYDPADFDNPSTSSELLVLHEDEYIPPSSSLFASKPPPNLPGLHVELSRLSPQAQLSPVPLSPLLLMMPNSHLRTTQGLPSSGILDEDGGTAGSSSNTVPQAQVGGGGIAVTPSGSYQQIQETMHKGDLNRLSLVQK